MDVMQQTACLVFNPAVFGGYALLITCTMAGRFSASMTYINKSLITSLSVHKDIVINCSVLQELAFTKSLFYA